MKAYEYIVKAKGNVAKFMKDIAKSAGFADDSIEKVTKRGAGMGNRFSFANAKTRILSGSLSFLRSILLTLSTAFVGVGLFGLVSGMISLGAETESTRIQFQTLTQSVEVGNKLFDEINQFANVTPFNNRDLQKNANTLLAFGTNAKDVLPTLGMLGDVAGGNKEKLNSLTLAFSQVQSMGKLMGQDLMQMVNAGFNPLNEISRTTGKSMAYLKDKMSKGEISAEMVTAAFKSATSEGGMFNGMMEKMSNTLSGKWSTLVGKIQLKMSEFGESQGGFFKRLLDVGIEVVDNFGIVGSAVIDLLSAFDPLTSVVRSFIGDLTNVSNGGITTTGVMEGFASVIRKLSVPLEIFATGLATIFSWLTHIKVPLAIAIGMWWAFNIAMSANPISIVILAFIGLVGAITYAWNKLAWFRGGILGIWETMKGFGSMIKDYVVNRFWELIDTIGYAGQALWHIMNGRFKKAFQSGKDAIKSMVGVDSKKQLFNDAKGLGDAFTNGYAKGVGQIAEKNLKLFDKKHSAFKVNGVDYEAGSGNSSNDSTNNDTSKAINGMSGITGGGSKQTNINVRLDKLQEKTEIHSKTVQEGVQDMEDMIMQALLRVLNSVNQMQTT